MKKLILTIAFCGILTSSAQAFDPSLMMSSMPQALALMQTWSPHLIDGMRSIGRSGMSIGKAMSHLVCLPWGLIQCSLGAPFGYFKPGVDNVVLGVLSPFELTYQVVMFPVRIISLGAVQ